MSEETKSELPRPPRELASRVYAVEGWSDPDLAFDNLGLQTKEQIIRLLPEDWTWDGKKVLDFGCGSGRTLRHFSEEAKVAEFWGGDIHGESIEWIQENLDWVNAWQTAMNPPMGLEHGTFDLIYTVSVFTHLTDNATPWILELHRLLAPGGILIVSFMGKWTSEFFAGEPWDEDRIGKHDLYRHQDWDLGGPAVLISAWWLREHWGRAFEVVEIDQEFQNFSWAVLRKKEVNLSREEVEEVSDDPREVVALKHYVRQLQGEVDREKVTASLELQRALDERERLLAEQARVYEDSTSWKATRWLRAMSRRLSR